MFQTFASYKAPLAKMAMAGLAALSLGAMTLATAEPAQAFRGGGFGGGVQFRHFGGGFGHGGFGGGGFGHGDFGHGGFGYGGGFHRGGFGYGGRGFAGGGYGWRGGYGGWRGGYGGWARLLAVTAGGAMDTAASAMVSGRRLVSDWAMASPPATDTAIPTMITTTATTLRTAAMRVTEPWAAMPRTATTITIRSAEATALILRSGIAVAGTNEKGRPRGRPYVASGRGGFRRSIRCLRQPEVQFVIFSDERGLNSVPPESLPSDIRSLLRSLTLRVTAAITTSRSRASAWEMPSIACAASSAAMRVSDISERSPRAIE